MVQRHFSTSKTVSLFLIDTASPILARNALLISMQRFEFDSVKVFTNTPELYPGIDCVKIPELKSAKDYSNFTIREMPKYIQTDFILIIHYDGFILNGDEFSPVYYHYDYIGAPWNSDDANSVGNGGFSWRSKKLCIAVQEISNEFEDVGHEDVFICKLQRKLLEEKYQCFFPSKDMALHFAFESSHPRFPTFGFHGAFHLPIIYRDNLEYLLDNIPDRLFVPTDVTCTVFRHHISMFSENAAKLYNERFLIRSEQASINRGDRN